MASVGDVSDDDYDKLIRRIWTTKACRFNCHARLAREHRFSGIVFAILSLSLVAISILSLLGHLENALVPPDLITLMLSIILLVVGLIDSQDNKSVVSERMHRSALELLELYNYAVVSRADANARCIAFDKYSEIQRRYIDNHHTVDFIAVRLAKPKEFELTTSMTLYLYLKKLWFGLKIFLFPDGVALICMVILLLATVGPLVSISV